MKRALVAGALVLGTVFMSGNVMDRAGVGPSTAVAAPSAQAGDFQISAIRFATEVGNEFLPKDPRIEFDSDNNGVWVVFEYINYTGGELHFVARANGGDYAWGKVPGCCQFREHRIGFKLEKKGEYADVPTTFAKPGVLSALGVLSAPAASLPGAAYDVIIYLNNTEVGSGGFGVRGKQGLDNDNNGGNSGDNDNS